MTSAWRLRATRWPTETTERSSDGAIARRGTSVPRCTTRVRVAPCASAARAMPRELARTSRAAPPAPPPRARGPPGVGGGGPRPPAPRAGGRRPARRGGGGEQAAAPVQGDERGRAAPCPPHRVARRDGVVGVHEVEPPGAPQ